MILVKILSKQRILLLYFTHYKVYFITNIKTKFVFFLNVLFHLIFSKTEKINCLKIEQVLHVTIDLVKFNK